MVLLIEICVYRGKIAGESPKVAVHWSEPTWNNKFKICRGTWQQRYQPRWPQMAKLMEVCPSCSKNDFLFLPCSYKTCSKDTNASRPWFVLCINKGSMVGQGKKGTGRTPHPLTLMKLVHSKLSRWKVDLSSLEKLQHPDPTEQDPTSKSIPTLPICSSHRAAGRRIIRASGTFNFNGLVQLNHCSAQIGACLTEMIDTRTRGRLWWLPPSESRV